MLIVVLKSGFGGAGAVSLVTLTDQEIPVGPGLTLPLWVVETAALAVIAGALLLSERVRATGRSAATSVTADEPAAEAS